MSVVFADTFYFLALLNAGDAHHERALAFSENFRGEVWTTQWVLVEVADAFAGSRRREEIATFIRELPALPKFRVVDAESRGFRRGLELYARRPDKAWSLTDCISFVVMADEGLREALTGDRHFTQAGFVALFDD